MTETIKYTVIGKLFKVYILVIIETMLVVKLNLNKIG